MTTEAEVTARRPQPAASLSGPSVLVRALHAVAFVARSLGDALDTFRRRRRGERGALTSLVLRMRAKQFLMKLSPSWRFTKEKLFGCSIESFDYDSLVFLIEEVFLHRDYEFHSEVEDPLILDCGSNIGVALIYFKHLYPAARVVAFEPSKQTFEMLSRNVQANRLSGVNLHNIALTAEEGPVELYESPSQPGSGWNSTRPARLSGTPRTVDGAPLSKFISVPVDFLKMDIEGAEAQVLEELARAGKLRHVKELVVEYHHHIDPQEDALSRTLRLLEDNGFGYQIRSVAWQPPIRESFQDLLIHAYRK